MNISARLARAWRVLTWRHWAWATGIPVLVAVSFPFQHFDTNWYWAHWQALFHLPWFLLIAYLFLAAIAWAESSVADPPGPSAWHYIAAAGVASVVCVAIAGVTYELKPEAPRQVIAGQTLPKRTYANPEVRTRWLRISAMYGAAMPILHGWLATFIYISLRRQRRAARALTDAQMGRSEAQRSLLAAQLLAAHAQVDPAFVLERLETIERTYEADPAGADAQLDELIAFLRAAIPRLRSDEVAGNPT